MKQTVVIIFLIVSSFFRLPLELSAQSIDGIWATLAISGFTARKGLTSDVFNGKIYTICGIGNNGKTNTFINTLEVFDPASNSWNTPQTTGSATARYQLTSAEVNGKIYIIGGTDGINTMPLEVFDPTTNTWVKQSTTGTFTQRFGLTASVVGNKIYVIGGENNNGPLNTIEIFDPTTNTWSTPTTTGTFLPTSKLTSAVVGDKIYVMGGYDGSSDLNNLEVFDPATNTWTTPVTTGTFTPRDNLTSCVLGGKIYVIGGFQDGMSLNIMEVFDPATNTWSTLTVNGMMTARSELTCSVVNGEIYTIGGINGSIQKINEVFRSAGSGVRAEAMIEEIKIFPNLTTGIVYVKNTKAVIKDITVISILGERIIEITNPNSQELSIDLSKYPAGAYYIRCTDENLVTMKMVIRE